MTKALLSSIESGDEFIATKFTESKKPSTFEHSLFEAMLKRAIECEKETIVKIFLTKKAFITPLSPEKREEILKHSIYQSMWNDNKNKDVSHKIIHSLIQSFLQIDEKKTCFIVCGMRMVIDQLGSPESKAMSEVLEAEIQTFFWKVVPVSYYLPGETSMYLVKK